MTTGLAAARIALSVIAWRLTIRGATRNTARVHLADPSSQEEMTRVFLSGEAASARAREELLTPAAERLGISLDVVDRPLDDSGACESRHALLMEARRGLMSGLPDTFPGGGRRSNQATSCDT
jgi:hypothetical protein